MEDFDSALVYEFDCFLVTMLSLGHDVQPCCIFAVKVKKANDFLGFFPQKLNAEWQKL